MPSGRINISRDGRPLLDLRSFAREGPGRRDRLTQAEIEHIALTVRRAPEVMIKVLPKGTQDLKSVQRHLAYIDRSGKVELETDDGERLTGEGIEKELLENWDLDVDAHRRRSELAAANRRDPPKLVHKLMFSMPAGASPDKVLAAVRMFAREEFGLKHRYAMALHTDEPHPHVHMVVKAVGEQGVRLHIRKATLREWRREFSRHLRVQGIAANATDRAVRGVTKLQKSDGIYRAMRDGRSTHMRNRADAAATAFRTGDVRDETGKAQFVETRRTVLQGWQAVGRALHHYGQPQLAGEVDRFVKAMLPPRTERERLVEAVADLPRATDPKSREAISR